MTDEEKAQFLSDVAYFWHEKGDMERYVDFSMEKLQASAPDLAMAYQLYLSAVSELNVQVEKYL